MKINEGSYIKGQLGVPLNSVPMVFIIIYCVL